MSPVFIVIIFLLATGTASPVDYTNRTLDGQFTLDETLSCPSVQSVKVPSKVEKCTKDLFVFFNCGDVEKSGFLSKAGELSMASQTTKCSEDVVVFMENNFLAVKKLSNFVILELKTNGFFQKCISFLHDGFNDIHDWIKSFIIVCLVVIVIVYFCCFNNSNDIPMDELTSESASVTASVSATANPTTKKKSQSSKTKIRTVFCKCVKKCQTHMCPCKSAGLECAEQCHGGKECFNK